MITKKKKLNDACYANMFAFVIKYLSMIDRCSKNVVYKFFTTKINTILIENFTEFIILLYEYNINLLFFLFSFLIFFFS